LLNKPDELCLLFHLDVQWYMLGNV